MTQQGKNMTAGRGMSDSEFRNKVYRIVRKIAHKYGGVAKGSFVSGELGDGISWSATILRQNASNGEVAGKLELTVNRNGRNETYSGFGDWDRLFVKAGIPVVTGGSITSSVMVARELAMLEEVFNSRSKEGCAMNKTKIASELLVLAKELLSMEFDTKEQMEQYKRDHDVRPGTKMTVKKETPVKKDSKPSDKESKAWERVVEKGVLHPTDHFDKKSEKEKKEILKPLVESMGNKALDYLREQKGKSEEQHKQYVKRNPGVSTSMGKFHAEQIDSAMSVVKSMLDGKSEESRK